MSTTDNERLLQLLADRATTGLGPGEAEELAGLLARSPETEADAIDVAAAAVDLAAGIGTEPLPARLRARVLEDARSFAAPAPAASASPSWLTWTGWIAAAACLVVAAAAWWPARAPESPPPPTASALRERLVADAPDLVRAAWEATKDPAGAAVRGDVVWSDREQRGYMRFEGLAPNDPAAGQYQLWIFDTTQDERTPIDGGVFDVPASGGDVVVPIDAKLRVSGPTLFAVTYERPGGVVVSKRDRLVTLAKAT